MRTISSTRCCDLIALTCHPDSSAGADLRVLAHASRIGQSVRVHYSIEGDLRRLRIAPPRPPRLAERLWQHSCCELFVARKGMSAYHEFNFSPSGEWAAYAFSDYRKGGPRAGQDPGIVVHAAAHMLELAASVDAGAEGNLQLGLCAVIEDEHGRLSYWALRHAPGKPDFHNRDSFALELA
jgi:hypothetical protein